MKYFLMTVLFFSSVANAKEIALTFDDAPTETTSQFETHARTQKLIEVLKKLKIKRVFL